MKDLIQFAIAFGFAYLAVSVYEFIVYRRTSGALVMTVLILAFGFGALFIYNKIQNRR